VCVHMAPLQLYASKDTMTIHTRREGCKPRGRVAATGTMCAFGTSAAVEISGRREKSKEGERGTVGRT
jgi:hypothetical protein